MNSDQIYDQLERVARASGHAKRKLLIPELKPYLVAAYDPFTMYYSTKVPLGVGTSVFGEPTWALLHALARRGTHGQSGFC